jgi:hypothetical protein
MPGSEDSTLSTGRGQGESQDLGCDPHPALRATLSQWERDLPSSALRLDCRGFVLRTARRSPAADRADQIHQQIHRRHKEAGYHLVVYVTTSHLRLILRPVSVVSMG